MLRPTSTARGRARMSALLASCRWWRYPVKPPKRSLDYTRLRGKNRARNPVLAFTAKECRSYVPAKFRGHRDDLLKLPTCDTSRKPRRKPRPQRDEASKLMLEGAWTFGADGWAFTPAKRRNTRRVRPSFNLKINRIRNLPAWPERVIRFNWKPDQYQSKSVRRTRASKIETTDLRRFLCMKPYKHFFSI